MSRDRSSSKKAVQVLLLGSAEGRLYMYESFEFHDDEDEPADALRNKRQVSRGLTAASTLDPCLIACLEGVTPRYARFKMRQLALVLKLVGTENLHEAAAALNMSQPAAT